MKRLFDRYDSAWKSFVIGAGGTIPKDLDSVGTGKSFYLLSNTRMIHVDRRWESRITNMCDIWNYGKI